VNILEAKTNELRKQVKELCEKVDKRMKEIGDVDIMTYRNDSIIRELQGKICEIYRQGVSYCKTYGEATTICKIFQGEPSCLLQLMLSEELTCPIPPAKKEEKES